jgi:uncharacterized small protein (DUF1192 family)
MRMIVALASATRFLAACGPRPVAQTAPQTPPGAANDAQLTVAELQAKAAAAEAEANRLEAQANGGQADAPPPAAPPAGASAAQTLGAGDQTLQTGQYYKAIPVPMNAGDVYQVNYTAHGYTPVILVLDQNKQPFTQSVGGPNLQPGQPLTDEIRPDKPGTWYVVLTSQAAGSGGTFEVNIQKVTETPLQ